MVIKRSGALVPFDETKIVLAITKAMKETEKGVDSKLAKDIAHTIASGATKDLHIEQIQDQVEELLMQSHRTDVAKTYIRYRYKKEQERETYNDLDKEIMGLKDLSSEEVRNNANKDGSKLQTFRAMMADVACINYNKRHIVPKHILNEHMKSIYLHDAQYLDFPHPNCIDQNCWVHYKNSDGERTIQFKQLGELYGIDVVDEPSLVKVTDRAFVMGRDGWTRLKAIAVRKTSGEDVYTFKTRTGLQLKCTGKHLVPVIRDGKEILLEAMDIVEGDILLSTRDLLVDILQPSNEQFLNLVNLDDGELNLIITKLQPLEDYIKYKYETTLWNILKDKGYRYEHSSKSISVKEFKVIADGIAIPYDVFVKLRIKAKHSKNSFPLFVPYTPKLAKLYGYTYADGGVYVNEETSSYQVTFTNTDIRLINDFIDCFQECFDIVLNPLYPTENSTSPCIRATCGSRLLVKLFRGFAGAKKNGCSDMSIPDFIMYGDDAIKLAFLSACFDTDGNMGSRQMTYTSTSRVYAEQVLILLESLGYHPSIKTEHVKGREYVFGKHIGVRNYDTHTVQLSRGDEIRDLYGRMDTFAERDYSNLVFGDKNFVEDKIIAIHISNENTVVYDLETESHWFVANDVVVHNCMLIDWIDCFENGMVIANAPIETPKSLSTAVALLSQIVAHASSNCYGGVTLPELTTGLTPYMKKSYNKHLAVAEKYIDGEDAQKKYAWDMLVKEVKDCCQSLEYEIQTLTNSRGEVPFITLELNAVDLEANEFEQKCQEAFLLAYLETRTKGLSGDVTPVFPKLVFELDRGNNLEKTDPYYHIFKTAVKCSSLRVYPDFISKDKLTEVSGGYKAPMGCRSFLPEYVDENGQRKTRGRMNQGVVSINLPRLAIQAGGDEGKFYSLLDDALELTKEALLFRHNKIKGTKASQAPILYQYGVISRLEPDELIDPLLFNSYSSISVGYVGLHNALMALYGSSYDDPETLEKGVAILKYMRAFCDKCKEETNIGFSLYSTPRFLWVGVEQSA